MKNRLLMYLFILSWLIISPYLLYSQNKNEDIRDKIEKIKLDKLVKRLNLDEQTSEIFKDKYRNFSKNIRELNQKRVRNFMLMAVNLKEGNGLDTLIDQVINIETDIQQERVNFLKDLRSILSSKQIATMIIFERKFNTELRKLLKDFNKLKNE